MRQIVLHAVAIVVACIGRLIVLLHANGYLERPLRYQSDNNRANVRRELMHRIKTHRNSRDILRMGPHAFRTLVSILKQRKLLKDTKYSYVEEQVTKFLYILAHNEKNRVMNFIFRRSGETVSRHFHQVLRAIISLEDEFLIQPDGVTVPTEILDSTGRFYPYFKNCIGAIDGTHIRVKVPKRDAARFRGRKGIPTMNVLAACTFNLRFSYVLAGWEGSASDSRILENALIREDNLKVPEGKFYLADAGFPLRSAFIIPYRSTRYHLKEYSRCPPENEKELFNLRHASLRNAIERAFGVLKKRFPIIASGTEAHYDIETRSEIVLACCLLHNFLMMYDLNEDILHEVDNELMENPIDLQDCGRVGRDVDARRGEEIRDHIASQMWLDYVSRG